MALMTWMLGCFWLAFVVAVGGGGLLAAGGAAELSSAGYLLAVLDWVLSLVVMAALLLIDAHVSKRSVWESLWVGIKDPLAWLLLWWP
jgi:hypothetical protein